MKMDVLSNREQLLKVLGKYKKEVKLVDDDTELLIVLSYPKLKNSISFWDTVYAITNLYDKSTKENAELSVVDSMKMSEEILSPLSRYIYNCIEIERGQDLTDDEKELIYIYIMKNYKILIEEFSKLFGALFQSGDATKKPQVEVSPTE